MKWNHLPVEGGIYAQHPKLIDEFQILFAAQAEQQEEEQERQKRESKASQARAR